MQRRQFLQTAALACAISPGADADSSPAESLITRPIPSSGERLPVVGLGTWQTFDVGNNADARSRLIEVLKTLTDAGGSVVDSSPMYGRSETVVGELAAQAKVADNLFYATKVWTQGEGAGIREMQRSMQRMRALPMDLMQVHNLVDAEVHLQTLARWKAQNRVRYVGITHYHRGGYAKMQQLMRNHPLDFIQINYSMLSREIEQQVLPLAQEKNIAVLINRPYEGGQLFSRVRGRALPEWAVEFDCHSWGQFFLKFILAHPAVTCVIPGTSKVRHMRDNLAAGRGRLPDEAQRKRMLAVL